MLEMLLSPRMAERKPWSMFFVGLIYASLAVLLVNWIFASDSVLSKYMGVLVVTFTVMFSMPFMYYLIKGEEEKEEDAKSMGFFREHKKPILGLLFLFLGFVVAFSFWYIVLGNTQSFQAQIETYCAVNHNANFDSCVNQYSTEGMKTTANAIGKERVLMIFYNNIYVLIFTLIFSLIFGAGAIFILAWNASVIAAAVGIFVKSDIAHLPIGISRYMIHGLPEIAAYFIGALAGGIISVAIIRQAKNEKFWKIMQDSLNLIIAAIIILFLAALIEVFVTPRLF